MGYQEEKQRQLDMRYLRMARVWAEIIILSLTIRAPT